MRLLPILSALTVLLTGCAQYAKVTQIRVQYHPGQHTSEALAHCEKCIMSARGLERRDPLAALGFYLTATEAADKVLAKNPRDEVARNNYNFALARAFASIQKGKLDPWTQPLRVPAAGGDFVLTHRGDKRRAWNPSLYDFTPADQFDVTGTYVTNRTIKPGIGAPLVVVGKGLNKESKTNFGMPRIFYGVTALAKFSGKNCTLAFEDPLATETVTVEGHSYPLAADFTVPLAVMLAETNPKKMELSRLLRPAKYADTARISRLQPYDPNKTVVLVIHGLKDSPATWAPMLNTLRGDANIRKNYQFWFYSYPSGYPYPYSAAILRNELDAIEKTFSLKKRMVVVGHSMGGCISRLLITDAGDKLWMDFFGKPPAEVDFTPTTKKLATDSLIFHQRPEVGRVVFIAAPLRGSDLAATWIARMGARLVKMPATLLSAGSEAFKVAQGGTDYIKTKRIPNSVDTLSPNNRFVKLINTIPVASNVPYHVISGDRGKGGNPDHTKPVKSDGIVPYWSSHMEGAQSELVVPSHHSAHQNPQAILEVQRILRLHLGR